ncbi:O-antigen ligase family protein [Denitratisoma sp. DHT3]|uniref:O-antigen ligase family protein n=1 Tax=Denitratisoma sp. DHT3 TaxID=1981880 RepID=UPI001647BB9E|nr:O-antigen ligase family protein [Denitratisoma sp. DHT3]
MKSALSDPSAWRMETPERRNWLPLAVVSGALVAGGLVALGGANALLIGLSLLVFAFVLLDFRIGVVLLVILTPISTSTLLPHSIGGITGLNPFNLLLLETLAAALLRGVSGRRMMPRPLVWLYLAPMILAAAVGAQHVHEIPAELIGDELLSFDNAPGYLRDVLVKPLLTVVVALLAGAAAARSKAPERMLFPVLISIFTMCMLAIVFVLYSGVSLEKLAGSESREFFQPLGIHANDLGRLYTFAYALLLFAWTGSRGGAMKIALGLGALLAVVALVCTFSRSAFLGFVVVNGLFLLSRGMGAGLFFGAAALAVLVLLLPGAVFDRVTMGWGLGLNAISAGRMEEIWLPLLPELWRHPLIGNGLGSIAWSDAMRSGRVILVTHPHNAYLQTFLDMGVVGLAMLGAYFVHVWREFRRLSRDPDTSPTLRGFFAGAAAGLVSLMLSGISGGGLTPGLEQSFLWLAIGMMYGRRHANAKEA